MKPHVVCVPSPSQSHIGGMLKLAKILHHRGFFITFVNTDFNHQRLLRSEGLSSLDSFPDWQFVSIPDGLPPSDADATQDIHTMCDSSRSLMVSPFSNLIDDLNCREGCHPPITFILSDGFMNFITSPTAERLRIRLVHLFTINACALMAVKHHRLFLERHLVDRRGCQVDVSRSERLVDWIPGMKNMRERDMPSFYGATNLDDPLLSFSLDVLDRTDKADATIIHTFEELEPVVLHKLSSIIRNVFAIGPFHLILDQIPQDKSISKHVHGNLWGEHAECLEWLDTKEPGSVLYVNFGSIAFLTPVQLTELAVGLANSEHMFLWVLRPDLMDGEAAVLPPGFVEETKERGFLSGWCPQEKVLNHGSIGGFLTHCGWNSVLESLTAGVPMICWPNLGDQQPNARYVCEEWKAGLEFGVDVNRDEVERVVRELLGGEKGKELKRSAIEWKRLARVATSPTGTSAKNLDKLIKDVLSEERLGLNLTAYPM